MKTLHYSSSMAPGMPRELLVLLPGAGMTADDFAAHGFVAALRRRAWDCDVLAVETGVETYLDDDIAARLHDEVIAPALETGVAGVWLAGISVGGFGALSYVRAGHAPVAGVLLLAPFLGSGGLIAKVASAGSLYSWSLGCSDGATSQQRLLAWLASDEFTVSAKQRVYLGFGEQDRFAVAHRLLAELLPAARVRTVQGGHDWPTWEVLWDELLATAIGEPGDRP